jgi:Zn-finger nucleic acid-binding protein
VFTLPEPEETAAALSCPQCGANVAPTRHTCEFCSAALLVKACPRCFARIFHGARHCSHCGAHVEVPATAAPDGTATPRKCPRCTDPTLEGHLIDDVLLDECPVCHGVFIDAAALERILHERKRQSLQALAGVRAPGDPDAPGGRLHPRGGAMYIRCPDCETVMNRKNFGRRSGIIVDSCRDHGTWFDSNELPRVIEFVSSGGLQRAQERELEDRRERARQAQFDARMAAARDPWQSSSFTESRSSAGAGLLGGLLGTIGGILSD